MVLYWNTMLQQLQSLHIQWPVFHCLLNGTIQIPQQQQSCLAYNQEQSIMYLSKLKQQMDTELLAPNCLLQKLEVFSKQMVDFVTY